MILSKKRITKALIRLRGCAGWSAPVLFANPRRQVFSRRGPILTSVFGAETVFISTHNICLDVKKENNFNYPLIVKAFKNAKYQLSYDVASGSKITPCIKIDKPPVVYRFWGNVMT